MNTVRKGTNYEQYVANVYRAILSVEDDEAYKKIYVEQNKKIVDRNGSTRQIDVYWEFKIASEKFKVAIECKNYESTISIDVVESFRTKLKSLGIQKGILATKVGFQEGAVRSAKEGNITLVQIRKVRHEDFEGMIQVINLQIKFQIPPHITSLNPVWDTGWFKKNKPNLNKGCQICISGPTNEIFLKDDKLNFCKSLFELENSDLSQSPPGNNEWRKDFEEGFLITPTDKYKIHGITVSYTTLDPIEMESQIDFKSEILAIMKYITGEEKNLMILRDGTEKKY